METAQRLDNRKSIQNLIIQLMLRPEFILGNHFIYLFIYLSIYLFSYLFSYLVIYESTDCHARQHHKKFANLGV